MRAHVEGPPACPCPGMLTPCSSPHPQPPPPSGVDGNLPGAQDYLGVDLDELGLDDDEEALDDDEGVDVEVEVEEEEEDLVGSDDDDDDDDDVLDIGECNFHGHEASPSNVLSMRNDRRKVGCMAHVRED